MANIIQKIQGHTLGHVTLMGPEKTVVFETHTCQHCGTTANHLPGLVLEDIGAICHGGGGGSRGCGEFICKGCAIVGDCKNNHIEVWMARDEKADRMRAARGLVAPVPNVEFSCAHCAHPVKFNPEADDPDKHAGGCGACSSPICVRCVDKNSCPKFVKG